MTYRIEGLDPARFAGTDELLAKGAIRMTVDEVGGLRRRAATMAGSGGADADIRGLLKDEEIDYVDVHNAAWGCFLARAERSGDG